MSAVRLRYLRSAGTFIVRHGRSIVVGNERLACGGCGHAYSRNVLTSQRWSSSATADSEGGVGGEAAGGTSSGPRGRRARRQQLHEEAKARKKKGPVWSKSDPAEDLCRIKWNPDPDEPPKGFIRGHIPDSIKCKIFELYSQDPETNSARALAKRFGLQHLDIQAILTLKSRAKELVDAGNGYELYPELEVEMTKAKEEFMEELGLDYGMELPFLYENCKEIDHEDPSTWVGPTSTVKRMHKIATLRDHDPNDKFDLPPPRTPEQVEEDLHAKRAIQDEYKKERAANVEKITGKLADVPRLPKKRWAYALQDTSSEISKSAPPLLRDADGMLRGAKVEEEMTMSYADPKLFRSKGHRRRNRLFKDVN